MAYLVFSLNDSLRIFLDLEVLPNPWIEYLTSTKNRHALPLFTSLLNVICSYDPIGYGVSFIHFFVLHTLVCIGSNSNQDVPRCEFELRMSILAQEISLNIEVEHQY